MNYFDLELKKILDGMVENGTFRQNHEILEDIINIYFQSKSGPEVFEILKNFENWIERPYTYCLLNFPRINALEIVFETENGGCKSCYIRDSINDRIISRVEEGCENITSDQLFDLHLFTMVETQFRSSCEKDVFVFSKKEKI